MSTNTRLSTPAATFTAIDEKLDSPTISASTARLGQNGNLTEKLPYWLVNVPPAQWPAECPAFLRDLPAKSIATLSTPDSEYKRQDWETVKELVSMWAWVVVLCARYSLLTCYDQEPTG
jgi:hypothetical protein